MLSDLAKKKIREAFHKGHLRTLSVSPEGETEWRTVQEVSRAEVPQESIWEVETDGGVMVLTGGHRVFVSPTEKVECERLEVGQEVLGVKAGCSTTVPVLNKRQLPSRRYMYDMTVDGWHNFQLLVSGVVVSNSPDRNYHFRPPEHEGRIGAFNRVFGQIWTDEELLCYLEMALAWWNAFPPETEGLCNLDILIQQKSTWKPFIVWGAIVYAMFALATNWVADEFSVSGDTLVRVILSDGREFDLPISVLHRVVHDVR